VHTTLIQSIAYSIDFIQRLPLFIWDAQCLGCLYGPSHVAGPHLQVIDGLTPDELGEGLSILSNKIDAILIYMFVFKEGLNQVTEFISFF